MIQPSNGDVLRVNMGLYSHCGVYAESGHVIHYTGTTGTDDFNGIVCETTLAEFLSGSKDFSVCKFREHPDNLPVSPGVKDFSQIAGVLDMNAHFLG